jgi:glucokinase
MRIAAGIDIGGTNTVWGFIDQTGKVLKKGSFLTQSFDEASQFVRKLSEEMLAHLHQNPALELIGIGIGAPNGNFIKGTVELPPNLPWKGITPLKKLFLQYFEQPIWVTNDANAAATGEMLFGAAKGMKDFIVITLGTGLGSGFVSNGKLMYGHDAFAGELGHTIIEPDGRSCGCGRKGCLETYVSASGIVRTAKWMLQNYHEPTLLHDFDEIYSKTIAQCAEKGDLLALKIFDYTAQKLGFSLANTVAISSPEAIILFGGLANAGDLIIQPTKDYMEHYLLNLFKNKVRILRSTVPQDYAAILGSAALVWKNKLL